MKNIVLKKKQEKKTGSSGGIEGVEPASCNANASNDRDQHMEMRLDVESTPP